MRQVTIYTTDKEYDHFIELAKNLHYVKKIETDETEKQSVLHNIKVGLDEVRLFKKGKLKTTSAKDFLNELSIQLSSNFKKEAKRLVKKYPSLKGELAELFTDLEEDPTMGTPLGNDIYKIRLAIASKNKGKSGGARVLSFVKVIETTVLLFSIYSKGEVDTLTDKEIQELIKDYL